MMHGLLHSTDSLAPHKHPALLDKRTVVSRVIGGTAWLRHHYQQTLYSQEKTSETRLTNADIGNKADNAGKRDWTCVQSVIDAERCARLHPLLVGTLYVTHILTRVDANRRIP